jgi:hypothetical protein
MELLESCTREYSWNLRKEYLYTVFRDDLAFKSFFSSNRQIKSKFAYFGRNRNDHVLLIGSFSRKK